MSINIIIAVGYVTLSSWTVQSVDYIGTLECKQTTVND